MLFSNNCLTNAIVFHRAAFNGDHYARLFGASITSRGVRESSSRSAKRDSDAYERREMTERFNRRLRRLREHHAICEQRHRRNSAKDGMKTSHQDGRKRDEEDLDGQKRDEEDQDGQNDFIQEICIEEQSNQGNKDWSDLDESEGSVFVPSVEESTDEEDLDSEESQLEKTIRKTVKDTIFNTFEEVKKAKQKTQRKKAKQKSPRKMTIKTSQRDPKGKRTWNKKQYCVFCEKAQSKLARHLERSHSNETEVAKAFSFPKRSKERRILLEQLRNQGNYYHNIKVLETGRGEIITWRQPTEDADISEFLPCPDCLAFFMKKDLWKHSKTCRGQRDVKRSRGERVRSAAVCLIPTPAQCSAGISSLLQAMRQDEISETIMKDSLICLYGESLYTKCGHDKSQHQYIIQKMRELARFMIEVKSRSREVSNLTQLCNPENFLLAIAACKEVSSYQPDLNTFKTPSLALKIGYSLKKACQLSLGQSLMEGDRDTEKKLKNFIKLIDSHWRTNISSQALNTLQQSKWNKGDTIPLTEDVVALQKHLKSVEQVSKDKLKENVNGAEWKILAETLLCQIILFNRRREGEASKLLLASYVNRNVKPPNEDVVKSLTKLERELCNELTRLEIQGKRGKKVPVLLTKDMLESMDLLNESRSTVGISEANPYVFARLGALTHIRGSDCLRKFSKTCGAKDPKSLTSTKLRKQIATLSQIMNLKNNELDQLAKFLGHDIRVHREYYRLSENTIQLAKVSKLLLSLEKGSDCYKGKSLEEITFSTEETENDRSPASGGLREHECRTTEADASEKDEEPSTSVKTVEHKRHVTETVASEKDEQPSSSVKTVKRKRRVTETDASENDDQPSTSGKTVKRSPPDNQNIVEMFSGDQITRLLFCTTYSAC
ncbi:uncharacterized protein LOC113058050 [Carassius auratus]|uniref:Uncharacterized protein LOC113058050 n=1 Tax=Carassius auratus TaxID=7957 RepID=A0A6P6LAD3_CARAU|nr:uncharacterized protein LOC113058050 [Carassius auratus]